MRTSESIAAIAAALAAAQSEMGKAIRESTNPHFRSKYADLGNVMDACLPALNKNGIALIQPVGQDECGTYVDTVLVHTSGEWLACRVPLIIGKNDMQGFGSAQTYARRYGLMAMAGIAPEDDDGNAAVASRQPPRPTAPPTAAPKLSPEELAARRQAYLDRLETLTDETIIKTTFMEAVAGLGLVKGSPEYNELRQPFVDRIEALKPKSE